MSHRPKDFFANNGDNPVAGVASHPMFSLMMPIIIVTALGVFGFFARGVIVDVDTVIDKTTDLIVEQRVMIVEQRMIAQQQVELGESVKAVAIEVNDLDDRVDDIEVWLQRLGLVQ